jgi:hypothetical protein
MGHRNLKLLIPKEAKSYRIAILFKFENFSNYLIEPVCASLRNFKMKSLLP